MIDSVMPMGASEAHETEQNERAVEAKRGQLEVFGLSLMGMRKDAISARQSSGVEDRWSKNLDQYYGVDEVNRSSMTVPGQAAPSGGGKTSGSNVFIQITRQRTDSSAARLADMLYPTDEKNWEIGPTPNPEIDDTRDRSDGMAYSEGEATFDHPDKPGQKLMVGDVLDEQVAIAKKASNAMEVEIDDQLVECNYNAEGRSMIEDAAQLGTGILKGPIIVNRIQKKWERSKDVYGNTVRKLVIKEDPRPASFRVDPWCIYPDPACGEDPQNGSFIFEMNDNASAKFLRDLKRTGLYFDDAIEECLRQKPHRFAVNRTYQGGLSNGASNAYAQNVYEIWTYTGSADVGDLRACDCPGVPDELVDTDVMSAIVVMCNDKIIRVLLNPMDGGDLPYDFFQWSKVRGTPWGVGIPHMIEHAQATLNAGWRTTIDNASVTHGPQIVVNKELIKPADGVWEIRGNKLWLSNDESDIADVQKAFYAFNIDNNMGALTTLIDLSMKWIDEESGQSMLAQGEMGRTPDHVGVAQIMQNAANVIVRRLAKRHDDMITTPHITRYHDWNMQYSENEEVKNGDYQVRARGSTALLLRDQQGQMMQVLVNQSAHPVHGIYLDSQKIIKKQIEAARIPAETVMRDEDDIKRILEMNKQKEAAAAKQGADPRIAAAQIQAESRIKSDEIRAKGAANAQMIEAKSEERNALVSAESARLNDDREYQKLELQERIKILELSAKLNITVKELKAQLAMKVMDHNRDDIRTAAHAAQKAAGGFNPRGGGDERPSPN